MLGDSMMLGGGRKAAYSIDNSLLFRGAQHLSKPIAADTSATKTVSFWIRRGALGQSALFSHTASGVYTWYSGLRFDASDKLVYYDYRSDCGVFSSWTTAASFRDCSSWYHILISWDGADFALHVNGVRQSWTCTFVPAYAFDARPHYFWSVGLVPGVTSSGTIYLGYDPYVGSYFNGQMAEICHVDGQALSPSSLGKTDPVTGSWRPTAVTGIAWGTNGLYLGKPWKSTGLGTDYSGRGNTWTATGFAANDVRNDNPTNVYATPNPLYFQSNGVSGPYSASRSPVFSNGNGVLSVDASPSSWACPTGVASALPILPGARAYFECAVLESSYIEFFCGIGTSADVTKPSLGDPNNPSGVGFTQTSVGLFRTLDTGGDHAAVYAKGVALPGWGSGGSHLSTVQIAVDLVNNRLWIGQDGTWPNGSSPSLLESGIPLAEGLAYFPWFAVSTYSLGGG